MSSPGASPPGLAALCNAYGLLVAQGVLEREDAWEAVRAACRDAGAAGADTVGSPLRIDCAWGVNDATFRWELARSRVAEGIKKAIAGMIAEWAEVPAILARAHAVNEAAAGAALKGRRIGPLLPREVRAIVSEEVGWWLRCQPRRRRRHVR